MMRTLCGLSETRRQAVEDMIRQHRLAQEAEERGEQAESTGQPPRGQAGTQPLPAAKAPPTQFYLKTPRHWKLETFWAHGF